ncbi:peptide/nickel transport system substrate-binding protein [Paenibacillus sp. DS2015]|uniref:ABC transporter substrate-binding protein n=1 Tax=Paenibacillus sp. DS2015 TaxID=3373917 RepID=UPI003D210D86
MLNRSMKLVIVPVILLCILLAGCSKSASLTVEDEDKNVQSDRAELILAIGSEPEDGFDPTTGWGRYGSPLFQSTLLKRNHDLKIVNDLAQRYEVSDDAKVWTVKIRKDVKFSDGQPLTPADVVFTFEKIAQNASTIDLTNMVSVQSQGDDTVIFTLKESQSTFISLLISTGIVPKHAYGDGYAGNPIGSGPYQLVQWDKGQQVIVKLNPEYYGKVPFFKKLTFVFLNEDASFASAKTGNVDVAYIVSSLSNQTIEGMHIEDVKTVDNRGIMFPYVPSGGTTKDGYPIGNDVTSDIAIRRAVNVAIDRQKLVDGVLNGYGTPAYSANDNLPWWNPETVIQDGKIDEAKQLLTDAGWVDRNNDGIAEKGNLQAEFTMLYPSGDMTRQSLALATADMVKSAGIQINVEGKSWEEIEKMMHSDAVLLGFGSHDPLEMYNIYSTDYQGVEYYNPGYYSNSVVDEWMQKAMEALTEVEALEYWKNAQWDGQTGLSGLGDTPWAWLVNIDHLYLVNDKLDIGKQRIQPHTHGWLVTDNIEEWRWEE